METTIARIIATSCNNGKKGVTNDVITPVQIKINLICFYGCAYYTTGGKGGAGGEIYSPSGKVRIQFHVGLFTMSCLS